MSKVDNSLYCNREYMRNRIETLSFNRIETLSPTRTCVLCQIVKMQNAKSFMLMYIMQIRICVFNKLTFFHSC